MIELENIVHSTYGKGDYPEKLFDFFNWGAFAIPLVWGIVHGVWSFVWLSFMGNFLGAFLLMQVSESPTATPGMYFGALVIGQLIQGAIRLWIGMRANQTYWNLVSSGRARGFGFGMANKEMSIKQYLVKQRQWALIGMSVMVFATLLMIFYNYLTSDIAETAGTLFSTVGQDLIWFVAVLSAAYYLARQATLFMAPLQSFAYFANSDAVLIDGKQVEKNHPINVINTTTMTDKRLLELGGQVSSPAQEPVKEEDSDMFAYPLTNGVMLPVLGLGTYKLEPGGQTIMAVKSALDAGYRSFDTATLYKNEKSIGQAIKQYGIDREEVFLTSKVWNTDQGYVSTVHAFENSLEALDTDYLDMYLIHWPVEKTLRSTWRALEHLYDAGKVRAIGVCNFEIEHLEALLAHANIAPMVNQIELHPRFTREELVLYCWNHGLLVQSWAPLAQGAITVVPELTEIGSKYGKSEAQVALRWAIQHNFAVIPKSSVRDRIFENADIFDFALSPEDMARIDGLNRDMREGPDPYEYSWHLS